MSDFADGVLIGREGNNNGWGGDGWWILLLLLCGWGGNNGWNGNGGNNMLGYELGRVATTNDVASGFSTSAIMGDLNDIILGQQAGFAGVQQAMCQGFNGLERAIGDCCCQTQRGLDAVNFNMQKFTGDIQRSIDGVGDRIIGFMTQQEMANLRGQVQDYKFREHLSTHDAYLIDQLRPTARPAYPACNPYTGTWGNWGSNGSCNGNCFGNGF